MRGGKFNLVSLKRIFKFFEEKLDFQTIVEQAYFASVFKTSQERYEKAS